ncbi:PH domain-containing protein [Candidatus Pacearchaeota archaeon]|nr:PH domain-containing protein [Candidatus Pacearchaeota archaeon]
MKKKDDGYVILGTSNTRLIYIPLYIMVLIVLFFMLYLKVNNLPLNQTGIILGIVFIVVIFKFTELHRLSNYYEINQDALVHVRGLINKNSKNVDVFAISDIDIDQNLWQRMLGYGTVKVRLFSEDNSTLVKDIKNPKEFVRVLEKVMMEKRIEVSKNAKK